MDTDTPELFTGSYQKKLLVAFAMTNVNAQKKTKDMRIGKLVFEKIYPSDSTVEKYDYGIDFQRATQTHICALSIISKNTCTEE